MTLHHILVVEDEPELGQVLKTRLEALGYQVLGPAQSCAAALELIWSGTPDLAFIDTHLGSETCETVLDECQLIGVPIIVTSSFSSSNQPSFCADHAIIDKGYAQSDLQGVLGANLGAKSPDV